MTHTEAIEYNKKRKRIANNIKIIVYILFFVLSAGIVGHMDYEAELGIVHAETVDILNEN